MFEQNVDRILEKISPSDRVLDIGGWIQPFNRANYVIDLMPHQTRGIMGSLGPKTEFFSEATWINMDVSGKKPLPFGDKEIDFVICSHTLEDIRDPIWLCSEIVRIGKKGYIEVPSRAVETVMGIQGKHYAGYYHHRWLVEVEGSDIVFRFKPHLLHESWKYHFPKSFLRRLSEEDRISYLFWENSFGYKEAIQISESEVARNLEEFVKWHDAYPPVYYLIENILPRKFIKTALKKSSALRFLAEKLLCRRIPISDSDPFWSGLPEIYSP